MDRNVFDEIKKMANIRIIINNNSDVMMTPLVTKKETGTGIRHLWMYSFLHKTRINRRILNRKLDLSIKNDAYRKQKILQNIEIPRETTASAIWSY